MMEFKRYNDVMAPISAYLSDVLNAQSTTEEKYKICAERDVIKDILWKYVNADERKAADGILDGIIKRFKENHV